MGITLSSPTFCIASVLSVLLFSSSCNFQIDPPALNNDPLQVESIIAIGDGYMAGFTNSKRSREQMYDPTGLYEEAQQYAIPNLIIQQ